MKTLAKIIATGFGVGNIPGWRGTWGTLFGTGLFLILVPLHPSLAGVGILFWGLIGYPGILLFGSDDRRIVVDEIFGVWIVLATCRPVAWEYVLGFLLFRIFDAAKPPGVAYFDDRYLKGWGVLLDDGVAGLYAALGVGAARWLISSF